MNKLLFGSAGRADRGVVGGVLNSLRPSSGGADSMSIASGGAIVDGTPYYSDATVTKTPTIPTVGTTGHRLVLRKSWSAQTVRVTDIANTDGTAAIPAMTQTDGVTWDIPLCSFTVTTVTGTIGAFTDDREFTRPMSFQFALYEGGGVLTTGEKRGNMVEVPDDGEISAWFVYLDQSGSIVVDIWKDSYANYPAVNADTITGGAEPTVSGATKASSTTLSTALGVATWTRAVARGDHLIPNIDSIATATLALVVLRGWHA